MSGYKINKIVDFHRGDKKTAQNCDYDSRNEMIFFYTLLMHILMEVITYSVEDNNETATNEQKETFNRDLNWWNHYYKKTEQMEHAQRAAEEKGKT